MFALALVTYASGSLHVVSTDSKGSVTPGGPNSPKVQTGSYSDTLRPEINIMYIRTGTLG